ncbi:MAG: HAD-IA family hydrolase [Candidatus Binatia bacterium]
MPALLEPLQPSRIKASVFDLGGVLLEGGGPAAVRAFGHRTGLAPEKWESLRREIFGNSGAWAALERGEISYRGFIGILQEGVSAAGGVITAELAESFLGDPKPMGNGSVLRPELVGAIRRLKARMPTALLTNNVAEWRQDWTSIPELDGLFDVVVDSSEVGARKPEPRIYEITRERLRLPHDALFLVDDIGQNLKSARSLGWQTLLYQDPNEVLSIIETIISAA